MTLPTVDRLPRLSPVKPLLLLLAAGCLMLVAVLAAAERQNGLERERSRLRVVAVLQAMAEGMGAIARDYGVWDEAVEHLVVRLDADWADKNIGLWLAKNNGIDRTLMIAPDGSVPYAVIGGTRTEVARLDSPGLRALVAQARASAATERPEVGGIAEVDGRLVLATAVAVRPEDAAQTAPPFNVLVLTRDFAHVLPRLAETAGLPSLAVLPAHAVWTEPAVPLKDTGGVLLGRLTWSPPQPGSEFVRLSLPTSLGVFILIAALAGALWHQLRRAFVRLRRAYEGIAASDRRQRVFLGASPDYWLRLDTRGTVLDFIGPRDGLGEQAIAVGAAIERVLPAELAERLRQAMGVALFCGTLERFDFAIGVPPRWFEARVVRLDEGEAVFTASDVTARKTAEELLIRQAHYDTLTSLPNRVLALDRLAQAMARADRNGSVVGVAILDLVNFKAVNDTWGHGAGDSVLVEVGGRLAMSMRKSDTVGRLEGDEFLLVLPDIDSAEAVDRVVDKALQALRRPAAVTGQEVFIAGLAGVCTYPADGSTTAELLKNADTALYSAKRDGHAGVRRFQAAMTETLRQRALLETRLRRALGNGELSLHYQPLYDLQQDRIAGAEALLRWNPADMPPVGPQHFIPIAEATGLIIEIGRWALEEACRTAVAWRRHTGCDLRMAVNLSPRQFRHDIIADVTNALLHSGLPSEALELEITEGLLVDDDQAQALFKLRDIGLRLSIDDFGTGFSSLSYLRRFPFHTLKVDRAFVSNVLEDDGDATLTRTIVTMARGLGLSTVGEGVETQGQLEFLRGCGCDVIQGYLISPPVPPLKFRELLDAQGAAVAG